MISFLVATSWAFFDASDTATRALLAVLCGLLFLIVLVVACMEGAANSPKSLRQQAYIQVVWFLRVMRKRGKDGSIVCNLSYIRSDFRGSDFLTSASFTARLSHRSFVYLLAV